MGNRQIGRRMPPSRDRHLWKLREMPAGSRIEIRPGIVTVLQKPAKVELCTRCKRSRLPHVERSKCYGLELKLGT